MRPKIVILILVVLVGLVGLATVLKRAMGWHATQEAQVADTTAGEPMPPADTNLNANLGSSNSAAILEQLRGQELAQELEQIRELQADGSANPLTTSLLVAKVTHQTPEVRKAAVEALVQLNDTNAVSGLDRAVALLEDPREKVALMDAIAYLKLAPANTIEGAQEITDSTTNSRPAVRRDTGVPNPKFLRGAPKQDRRRGVPPAPAANQSADPANQDQTQPAPAAPEAVPAQ